MEDFSQWDPISTGFSARGLGIRSLKRGRWAGFPLESQKSGPLGAASPKFCHRNLSSQLLMGAESVPTNPIPRFRGRL